MIGRALVVASTSAVLLVLAAPPAAAAPSTAACTGQFFSDHARLVPDSDGQESVGGFIAFAAHELRAGFGVDISAASRFSDRSACPF